MSSNGSESEPISEEEKIAQVGLVMNARQPSSSESLIDDPIYRKLVESPLYQVYREAFSHATGLTLMLIPGDDEVATVPQERGSFGSSFCKVLNGGHSPCARCVLAHRCLQEAAREKIETVTCFARMRETAIPIRAAGQTVAFLLTGQVFEEEQSEEAFDAVVEQLEMEEKTKEDLRQAWRETPVVERERYHGSVTLLAAFALQLAELLNRLLVEEANAEPEVISKAKQFINANLGEKVCLEEVARHSGVSPYYFCKLFKQATEMTLTEYVNRRRVEWAKRRLLNPQERVTEVAFDVGYQSLSQFNRSFLRYVGVSPTRYREEQKADRYAASTMAA